MERFEFTPNQANDSKDFDYFLNSTNESPLNRNDSTSVMYALYDSDQDSATAYDAKFKPPALATFDAEPYEDEDDEEEVSGKRRHHHQHEANSFERFVYFVARALVVAVCITTVLFIFVFKIMTVSGNSMSPTVYDGDYIVINRLDKSPAVGDIVVIMNDSNNKKPTVKRIVASENQVVNIDYDKDAVYVDHVQVFADIYGNTDIKPLGNVTYPVKVPKDCYFVLGDNLPNSLDSRDASVGMIPKDKILGTVILGYSKNDGLKSLEDTPIDTPIKDIISDIVGKIMGFVKGIIGRVL